MLSSSKRGKSRQQQSKNYVSTATQAKKTATLQTALAKVHAWMTSHQLFSLEGFK